MILEILSYRSLFVICILYIMFNAALRMIVYSISTFFSRVDVSVHVIKPYSSIDYIADIEKFVLRLSDILDIQKCSYCSVMTRIGLL